MFGMVWNGMLWCVEWVSSSLLCVCYVMWSISLPCIKSRYGKWSLCSRVVDVLIAWTVSDTLSMWNCWVDGGSSSRCSSSSSSYAVVLVLCMEQNNVFPGDVKLWTVAKGYDEPCRHLVVKTLSNVVTAYHNKMLWPSGSGGMVAAGAVVTPWHCMPVCLHKW